MILEALSKESLTAIRSEIQEFQFSETQPYLNYWLTLEDLCNFELEKRLVGDEKLSPHHEIEAEASCIVGSLSLEELETLQNDVKL